MSKIIGQQVKLANQTYIDNSSLISVPNTTIVGRAQIADPSKDLSVNMGVNRIMTQQIYIVHNESGPNGEPVWAAINDSAGLIRFVGSWSNGLDSDGPYPKIGATNDFFEIVFYGTGLNLLSSLTASARDFRYTVDGGTESANFLPNSGSTSGVIDARGYSANVVMPVVAGLSLGIHTIKLRANSATNFPFYGIEILNESSSLKVNTGIAYASGSAAILTSQFVDSYNSNFTNVYGTPGARGGHVLVYMAPDGSIKKDIQYTNASQANLTSADHTNEELVRAYHYREFGAGRSDDFSNASGTAAFAFTLDDGTTTLTATSAGLGIGQGGGGNYDAIGSNISPGAVSLTFVGTGLDIFIQSNNTSRSMSVSVDGISTGTLTGFSTAGLRVKVVSGLPYGTHVVKFTNTSGSLAGFGLIYFYVYQPKKPALPAGAVELADYNIVADHAARASNGAGRIDTGVIRKCNNREFTYVNGTGGSAWSMTQDTSNEPDVGSTANSSHLNSYIEYTFFGTGFSYAYQTESGTSPTTAITLNGTALNASYPGASGITVGLVSPSDTSYGGVSGSTSGTSFLLSTVASNILDQESTTNITGNCFFVRNLPLAKYTVRFNENTAGKFLRFSCLDVITPIYSTRSDLPGDLQNTLTVGSQSISDNRKVGPNSVNPTLTKAWAEAVGVTSAPTSTSLSFVPMPDMSLTIKTNGGPIQIAYQASLSSNTATVIVSTQIFVDGVAVGAVSSVTTPSPSGSNMCFSGTLILPVAAGVHKVDLYWKNDSNLTMTAVGVNRILNVREL